MSALEIVIAVAGATVTLMVVAAMVLLTPSGVESVAEPALGDDSTSGAGPNGADGGANPGRAARPAPAPEPAGGFTR